MKTLEKWHPKDPIGTWMIQTTGGGYYDVDDVDDEIGNLERKISDMKNALVCAHTALRQIKASEFAADYLRGEARRALKIIDKVPL